MQTLVSTFSSAENARGLWWLGQSACDFKKRGYAFIAKENIKHKLFLVENGSLSGRTKNIGCL